MMDALDFMECATCQAKPGSPRLCVGCLHNRTTISRLKEEVQRLKWRLNHQTDDDVAECKQGRHEDCGA